VSELFQIVPAGDTAFLVEFENRLDVGINQRVVALWHSLEGLHLPGVRDLVPAYRSLGVYFDPLRTDVERLLGVLESAAAATAISPEPVADSIRVEVCYGGDLGPDLDAVAAWAGLTVDEVVGAHTAPVYRVFMIGFSPGFAYMGAVDQRIATPRRDTPRLKVPAGSVGIAGLQTGIYPSETPGGWMLLGRTAIRPFDPSRTPACLFKAGDRVRFEAISRAEYDRRIGAEAT